MNMQMRTQILLWATGPYNLSLYQIWCHVGPVETDYRPKNRVFLRPFTHGGICPPHMGGQVQGDKALMGGLMRGDIDLMGGPNFDRLYHKLKVSTVIVKLQIHDAIYRLRLY